MSPLLIALLGALLLPLFLASWRTSLVGLSLQGLLAGAIAYRLHPNPSTLGEWLQMADLVVVRGLFAPLVLHAVLIKQGAERRNDVIPPNLLSWTLAVTLVLVSFRFAGRLDVAPGEQQTLVAVAGSGVMLGLLVLASQSTPFSQMMGALRIENAIVLLELGGEHHASQLPIQIGLIVVFVATLALFRWYLGILGPSTSADVPKPDSETPSL